MRYFETIQVISCFQKKFNLFEFGFIDTSNCIQVLLIFFQPTPMKRVKSSSSNKEISLKKNDKVYFYAFCSQFNRFKQVEVTYICNQFQHLPQLRSFFVQQHPQQHPQQLQEQCPSKKRFSTRVATFAKGLSPSGSFRRKQYKASQSCSHDDTQQTKKAEVQVITYLVVFKFVRNPYHL